MKKKKFIKIIILLLLLLICLIVTCIYNKKNDISNNHINNEHIKNKIPAFIKNNKDTNNIKINRKNPQMHKSENKIKKSLSTESKNIKKNDEEKKDYDWGNPVNDIPGL